MAACGGGTTDSTATEASEPDATEVEEVVEDETVEDEAVDDETSAGEEAAEETTTTTEAPETTTTTNEAETTTTAPPIPTMTIDFDGLVTLGDAGVYELWFVGADGAPVSGGTFDSADGPVTLDLTDGIPGAVELKVSIETDDDPAPSAAIVLAGTMDGAAGNRTAQLTTRPVRRSGQNPAYRPTHHSKAQFRQNESCCPAI